MENTNHGVSVFIHSTPARHVVVSKSSSADPAEVAATHGTPHVITALVLLDQNMTERTRLGHDECHRRAAGKSRAGVTWRTHNITDHWRLSLTRRQG